MTKAELLLSLVSGEDLEAAIGELVSYIKQNRSALDGDLSTISGKVTTLIGSDAAKSVRTIANEELAARLIPQNAQEALDTLQEIAAWIQSHPGDATAMNIAITNLRNLVGTLPQETEATTVVGYITAEISAMATAMALLPTVIEVSNITALTAEQLNTLRPGDQVRKITGNEKHAYTVTYKNSVKGELSLSYVDHQNAEEVYYEKVENTWQYIVTDTTPIGELLRQQDFATIGKTAAAALVTAAIAAAETPAETPGE